jgi:2-polyprenyl-3-methyl-5-hydroxy-6-metoxy-1,4-benzoquinol methylase
MNVSSPQWNDEMYRRHSTPYTGLAGFVEALRVRAVLKVAAVGPQDRLLEVGCEAGHLLKSSPRCEKTVGFDISQAALADARAMFASSGRSATFIQGDASQPLPFERGDFSVIICSEMLEHVPDPRTCLDNIAAIADPECRIVLTVPNELPKLRIKALLVKTGMMRKIMPGIEEAQSEWHLQCFDAAKLRDICRDLVQVESLRSICGLHWLAVCRALHPKS